jgi:transposase
VSDVVYRQLVSDQKRLAQNLNVTNLGGQGGATGSSAADSNPDVDASDKSLPEPANLKATPAAVVKRGLLDDGEDR